MVFCSAGQFPEINVNVRAFLMEEKYNPVIALDVSNGSVKTWQLCIFEAHYSWYSLDPSSVMNYFKL